MFYYPVRKNLKTGKEWIDYFLKDVTVQGVEAKVNAGRSFEGAFSSAGSLKTNPVIRISLCDLYEVEVIKIIKEDA